MKVLYYNLCYSIILILMNNKKLVRLQKVLADCGVASRRKSEELINSGFVKVNGIKAKIGEKVDPVKDKITVKGKKIITGGKNYYVMVNKPRGYVCTMNDELGRKCVKDLVSDFPARLYPVGRLDKDSEGLLFMTNDGEFANKITHPSKHISKKYRVTIKPTITEEQLDEIRAGMEIDNVKTAPAEAFVISRESDRVVVEIILHEGKNRQIRNMCEKLGVEVARLKRIAIGPVKMGMLQIGKCRELNEKELNKLGIK